MSNMIDRRSLLVRGAGLGALALGGGLFLEACSSSSKGGAPAPSSSGGSAAAGSFGALDFRFDWITDRDMAIYTIVIAAAWHAAGFAMALFLAGLRSIDPDLAKAAQIDGAGPIRYYLRIVLPGIAPIAVAVLVILLQFAIKTFDLVRALTGGGPGIATTLPALVVYDFMFQRGQLGRGSAAAVLLLLSLLLVLLPYYAYAQWRARRERTRG